MVDVELVANVLVRAEAEGREELVKLLSEIREKLLGKIPKISILRVVVI